MSVERLIVGVICGAGLLCGLALLADGVVVAGGMLFVFAGLALGEAIDG